MALAALATPLAPACSAGFAAIPAIPRPFPANPEPKPPTTPPACVIKLPRLMKVAMPPPAANPTAKIGDKIPTAMAMIIVPPLGFPDDVLLLRI